MRHGLEVSCGGADITMSALVALGVAAERAGWDAVFFEDYLVHYAGHDPPTFDPWVLLAAISVQTSTIRLGTTVTALPRRHPAKLAREAVSLDHLSGGRVTVGVGLGDPADRGVRSIVGPGDGGPRGSLLDESLDVLLALLSGEVVHHDGPRFRVDGVAFRPPSVQQPRLPVWVGGSSHVGAVVRRAARADGIVAYKLSDTDEWSDFTGDEVAALAAEVAAHRVPGDPFDIAIGGRRRRDDESAERRYLDEIAAAGATWWLEFVPAGPLEQMRAMVERGPLR